MASEIHKKYYDFITGVVHEAGQLVVKGFENPKKVSTKGGLSFDLVTDTDKGVEEFIIGKIKREYPDHVTIGEETTNAGEKIRLTSAPTWFIDPIDGTMNFTRNIPLVSISVALAIEKRVVVGVVFNPVMNEFYSAVEGGGAYCNGKRIATTQNEDLHRALIINEPSLASLPFLRERTLERIKKLSEFGVFGFRSYGSAALSLCYVAKGISDVYYTDGLQCWDVVAGILILKEAGGCACNPNGEEFDMFSRVLLSAGNKALLRKMSEILTECDNKTKEATLKLIPEEFKPKSK